MDERDDFIGRARLRAESLFDEQYQGDPQPSVVPEERYEKETLLGEGAAGRVWKAYDRILKRQVALKLLRPEGVATRDRFLREARNQARVQHPNICKVFDIGEMHGEPYIAMHCVDGRTLSAASAEMTLREKVEIFRFVAEAIHAAHRSGLVHRDLKPGNILIEKTDRGWFPYITDFGLAREDDAVDKTKTGMIIGTPAYMAPEQAKGNIRQIDPRSDVYALGATFYEILCGQPPFTGTSVEIVMKTIQDEVPPLRKKKSDVPPDLEIIVMKCLEKESERRYYSAQALADDLARFLNGDPILARRTSWHYRIAKKARRHRNAVAILAVAFLVMLFSASFGLYIWWTAAKRAELAQRFGQEVAEVEGILRYASVLPLHDIRKEQSLVRQRMKRIQDQMQVIGKPSIIPGNYALGRGYFALRDYHKARTHLENAWNGGYQNPEIAFVLGRTMGTLYHTELKRLQQLADKELKDDRHKQIEKQFRDPALAYLRISKNSANISSDYLEALMAFYEDRYEDAFRSNAKAMHTAPLFYEAKKLEGDIHALRALQKQQSGNYKGAREDYEKAGKIYQSAAEIARSDPSIYDAECQRLIQVLWLVDAEGLPTQEEYQRAISACDLTLQVDPDDANAFSRKSFIYSSWAAMLRMNKGDPGPLYEKAIQNARKALEIKPDFAEAWSNLGNSYVQLAFLQWDTGIERLPTLSLALEAFQRAIKLEPSDASYRNLGDAYSDHAVAMMDKGIDPTDSFDASVTAYENAIRLNPRHFSTSSNLGMVLTRKGMYQLHHGKDPTVALKTSIEKYRKSVELNPRHVWGFNNAAVSLLTLSRYEMYQARNPNPLLDEAIQNLHDAMNIDPKLPVPHLNTARSYCVKAEYSVQVRRDPEADLAEARKAIHKHMEVSGDALFSNRDEATIELVAAEWALQNGRSARDFLRKAESSLRKALQRNSEDSEAYRQFARYYLVSAKDKIARGISPVTEIHSGLEQIAESLKRDKEYGESHAIQAELLSLSVTIQSEDAAKKQKIVEANTALNTAFDLNQNLRVKYHPLLIELQKHDME